MDKGMEGQNTSPAATWQNDNGNNHNSKTTK